MDSVLFVGPLDRVLLLRTLPMLEGLGPVQLAAIAQHAQERFFPAGAVLHAAAELTEAVYLIVEGEAEMRHGDGAIRRVLPGEAVGFIEMLSRCERRFEVRAATDTVALAFDWEAQVDVCEEHFPVVTRYIHYLARTTASQLRRQPAEFVEPNPLISAQKFGGRLSFIERVLLLSRSRAFSSGCLDALGELAQHVDEVRWPDGAPIWSVDAAADNFFVLAAGRVDCRLPSGARFATPPGRLIGMHEAVYEGRRWYDACSDGDSIALQIDTEPFMDILEDHFDLAFDFMASLAADVMKLRAGNGKPNLEPVPATRPG